MVSWNPATWFGRDDEGGREYAPGHEPSAAGRASGAVKKQRQRKQDVERRTTLPPELRRNVRNREGVMKPYDPLLLKELAENWVSQAYVDTMAQDLATAPWTITARDEGANPGEAAITDAERVMERLHPEKSLRDLLEMTARNTLKLGDGAWVKHYDTGGDLREAIPVDSARMFKQVDDHGLTEGYLQASFTNRSVQQRFDLEEIVWFEWSSREDHVYGFGPVEKGADVIEVIEELGEKEQKDLTEGMPPGIVSVREDEDTPMAVDAYEKVKDNWQLKEGERHRAIVSMGDWEFTPLQPGYQELQFMERNKMWIQSLGATFKVNAPYAGFDFQEGNRAQNKAQTQAYKQRGFQVLLRQVQEALNRQLVWPDLGEDLVFEFENLQTVAEKQTHAEFQQTLADAAEAWDNLGRTVTLRGDRIDVEDGEVDAPDEPAGGGPFGMTADSGPAAGATATARKSVGLQSETGVPGVPDTPDGMADWQEFLEAVATLGGIVENGETGRAFPGDYEGDLLTPAETIRVYGVNDSIVGGLLEDCGELNYTVTQSSDARRKDATELDDYLLSAFQSQIQPASLDAIEKRAWTESEEVPEYVTERIGDAIDAGAVFDDIASIPARTVERLTDLLETNLTQPQGWSLDSVVEDMQDVWPGVSEDKLETVARTETASVLNEAREQGYEDLPGVEDEPRFYWQGPDDSRTTEACEELKDRTNPQYGGTPVRMPDLVRIEEDVQAKYFPDLSFRRHCPHISCRHTFVRAPPQGGDVD
jgi:hypothetical protein